MPTRPVHSVWIARLGAVLVGLTLGACGPGYLDQGHKVPATEGNRAVFEVIQAYHAAVEAQDPEAVKRLVSSQYHENAGTTDRSEDDYGYDGLVKRLSALRDNVKKVQLRIRLLDMAVADNSATVDVEFFGRVLLTDGGVDTYKTWNEFSRLQLVREDGSWKIAAGL